MRLSCRGVISFMPSAKHKANAGLKWGWGGGGGVGGLMGGGGGGSSCRGVISLTNAANKTKSWKCKTLRHTTT